MSFETEDPFKSIRAAIAFSSKDWALDKADAWVYAIVVGWDDEAFAEMAIKHRWNPEVAARLKRLRAAYKASADMVVAV